MTQLHLFRTAIVLPLENSISMEGKHAFQIHNVHTYILYEYLYNVIGHAIVVH